MRGGLALLRAGRRRYSTYRQATVAAAITNSFFGLVHCYAFLAVAKGSAAGAAAAGGAAAGGAAAVGAVAAVRGYTPEQLALYCWVAQGLIGVLGLWGWTELADRIRTGDVMVDLLRPVHPIVSYLAVDLGRAAHAVATRFIVPVVVGALLFDLYRPRHASTYPLFVVSAALAVLICFAGRYLVNATGFWLLDIRGPNLAWTFATTVLSGLSFPLRFLPGWAATLVWATPFPWLVQAPLDIAVERAAPTGLLAGQAAWAVGLLGLCWWVQRRADRRLVIQGG